MKQKNVYAIKQLLATALYEVIISKARGRNYYFISQLERFQLIYSGIEAGAIPDVTNANSSHKTQLILNISLELAPAVVCSVGFGSRSGIDCNKS